MRQEYGLQISRAESSVHVVREKYFDARKLVRVILKYCFAERVCNSIVHRWVCMRVCGEVRIWAHMCIHMMCGYACTRDEKYSYVTCARRRHVSAYSRTDTQELCSCPFAHHNQLWIKLPVRIVTKNLTPPDHPLATARRSRRDPNAYEMLTWARASAHATITRELRVG